MIFTIYNFRSGPNENDGEPNVLCQMKKVTITSYIVPDNIPNIPRNNRSQTDL